jgi:putative alpha-1,2-mannosidase
VLNCGYRCVSSYSEFILLFRNKYYGTRRPSHVSESFRLTNTTQVGTHADSLIAEAVLKGITGFDLDLAWEAVHKDATVPPRNDNTTV